MQEGQSGWAPQAVISRAYLRRIPRNGKSYFTMMSLHINDQLAKKRGIAKNLTLAVRTVMHQEQVDMVAGLLWCHMATDQVMNSAETALLWMLLNFYGATWRRCIHGAFEIPLETLGVKHSDQSCQREVWIHLLRVNALLVDRPSRDGQYRQPFVVANRA